jgi:exonuclease VII large subunit
MWMKEILTVSQLNENIKAFLEESFGTLWVEGEVSNLRRPQAGHVYFTLKDDKSQIRAVYFRPFGARAVRFDLEDGMKIICRARLTAYVPRGEYQLIVETVEPQGTGALQKAFEQLKAKLAAEGLFDASRKKPLPFLPARIGVVTSPSGAVIRDILNVTRRRFPSVDILIAPTRVQGATAAGEIHRGSGASPARRRHRGDHSRAGRRLAGGPGAVQRRSAGARRRAVQDSRRLGGGPRNGLHHLRFCRGSARAHAVRGGRAGCSRTGRT